MKINEALKRHGFKVGRRIYARCPRCHSGMEKGLSGNYECSKCKPNTK
jgi:hypothetical protein